LKPQTQFFLFLKKGCPEAILPCLFVQSIPRKIQWENLHRFFHGFSHEKMKGLSGVNVPWKTIKPSHSSPKTALASLEEVMIRSHKEEN
jgi:hypothetical protein